MVTINKAMITARRQNIMEAFTTADVSGVKHLNLLELKEHPVIRPHDYPTHSLRDDLESLAKTGQLRARMVDGKKAYILPKYEFDIGEPVPKAKKKKALKEGLPDDKNFILHKIGVTVSHKDQMVTLNLPGHVAKIGFNGDLHLMPKE